MNTAHIQQINLSSEERDRLKGMFKRGRHSARELRRARILLRADEEKRIDNSTLAAEVECSRETVRTVRKRYMTEGVDAALYDKPRPGQPKKLDEKDEAFIIATACSDPPDGTDHWTLEMITTQVKVKRGKKVRSETVRRVILKNNLKPWQEKNVVHTTSDATI